MVNPVVVRWVRVDKAGQMVRMDLTARVVDGRDFLAAPAASPVVRAPRTVRPDVVVLGGSAGLAVPAVSAIRRPSRVVDEAAVCSGVTAP